MIYKIQLLFEKHTINTEGKIINNEQFDYFINLLIERRIIIEHDVPLLKKFIIDFPFNFVQFCSYIKQIYQFEIEQQIGLKINSNHESITKIFSFLDLYEFSNLDNKDIYTLLVKLSNGMEKLQDTKINFNAVDFLLKNIRDEINKLVWDKIFKSYQNYMVMKNSMKNKNDEEKQLDQEQVEELNENENDLQFSNIEINTNADFTIANSQEYQLIYKPKIEYEYEIIKTKRVHTDSLYSSYRRKVGKILIEKTVCSDRDIPVETWKIPFNYFDKEILSNFYYKCEALRELLLSKHFQKFTGFDDLTNDDYQIYFFENIEGIKILDLLKARDIELLETSMLFIYLAKEILTGLRDLLYKSTYTFKFHLNCTNNIYYEIGQQRLYIHNIEFNKPRKSILESHEIIEAKLLFDYGMILIELLSHTYPELNSLLKDLNGMISTNENEFIQMKLIFDRVIEIEKYLNRYLENDTVIAIIIECLITPYKANLIFDDFYESKNFLKEFYQEYDVMRTREKVTQVRISSAMQNTEEENKDKFVAYEPYYTYENLNNKVNNINNDNNNNNKSSDKQKRDQKVKNNKEVLKFRNILTLNLLLIHPYFDTKIENNFISYLLKDNK